ncbi:MAG: Succinate dehydrogenase/Fumarate reductase transmembrane subunit [Alphaproteobacteria bacterium ADurb.BinA280]|jgi:succinate dehydrogenase / fumarate reductase, membrane anchor subunit|nr:succinate dehydrogenase, hydrophobic membrane anchor protein [Xanthomonadales bacterium]MCC6504232.1 succinate dehydrogenase, hydrophobic membrane anchor protein [Aquimonas sp.]OPZ07483.1 MAG: Succinate dehydrogenase/Fumarate reductase transmembrane subunit [Alphaproteobacteria bacterium ADurb.BinA280]
MSLLKPSLRDPLARVRGVGSARHGTEHFILQRISAVILALLTPWLLWLLITLIPADYATVRATLSNPIHAILLLSFLMALFWHSRLGLQVVIEDYVHHHGLGIFAQILVLFCCSLGALVSLLAISRILFAA